MTQCGPKQICGCMRVIYANFRWLSRSQRNIVPPVAQARPSVSLGKDQIKGKPDAREGHMAIPIRRRELVLVLGGIAAAWPLVARAQPTIERGRRIGVLMSTTADDPEGQARIAAFHQGLQERGWTLGRNARVDVRWGAFDADSSRHYATELVALAPEVIVAFASAAMGALQQMRTGVPIVFVSIIDPVGAGFVENLARPGGNVTGFSLFEYGLSGKWLELLKEIAPSVTRAAVLREAAIASGVGQYAIIQALAPSLGIELRPDRRARSRRDRARRPGVRARAELWSDHRWISIRGGSSRSHHRARRPSPIACCVPLPVFRSQRRPGRLRP